MPSFSDLSLKRLSTCHPDLILLFDEVIKYFDCIILEGHRNKEDQDKAFNVGKSQLQWPNGKHNTVPSLAVDVAPYDIGLKNVDWSDVKRMYFFAGHVIGIAEKLREQGIITHRIRFGGDWDMDKDVKDNKFSDLVHFELLP